MAAGKAGLCMRLLQGDLGTLQAEGESPVTAIHSFPASSSEERHRGGQWSYAAFAQATQDEGHPRAGAQMQPPAWNLEKQVCKQVQSVRTVRGQCGSCGRACRLGVEMMRKKHQREEKARGA